MSVNNLPFPSEIRQNMLYMLPCAETYRYSQVAKAFLADVQYAATLPQLDITLTGKITTICFDENDRTMQNLLYLKLRQEAFKAWFTNFFPNLPEYVKQNIKEMQSQVVSMLRERRHFPQDAEREPILCLPQTVVFDLSTKQYTGEELEQALIMLTDEPPSTGNYNQDKAILAGFKAIQPIFAKAIFSHTNAKDMTGISLRVTLRKTVGAGFEDDFTTCRKLGKLKIPKNIPLGHLHFKEISNIELPKMLEARQVNDCKIPKLIFSHPKAAEMDIQEYVGTILLCAVRYRNRDLVQMILKHQDAKAIEFDDLERALIEATEAGEHEIAYDIHTFGLDLGGKIEKKLIATHEKAVKAQKDEKCVVS